MTMAERPEKGSMRILEMGRSLKEKVPYRASDTF